MDKFIPYEKLSKKEKRKLDLSKRQTWGELNPVTRKPANSKAYNRNKSRNWVRDYHGTTDSGIFLVYLLSFITAHTVAYRQDNSFTAVLLSGIILGSRLAALLLCYGSFASCARRIPKQRPSAKPRFSWSLQRRQTASMTRSFSRRVLPCMAS